jgi:hypothetical protein
MWITNTGATSSCLSSLSLAILLIFSHSHVCVFACHGESSWAQSLHKEFTFSSDPMIILEARLGTMSAVSRFNSVRTSTHSTAGGCKNAAALSTSTSNLCVSIVWSVDGLTLSSPWNKMCPPVFELSDY